MDRDRYDQLSKEIPDACLAVRKAMGPGCLNLSTNFVCFMNCSCADSR